MRYLTLLIIGLSSLEAGSLTLMSKSTIFGVFEKKLLTPVCHDKRYVRHGVDQTCFLMADGQKLFITRKQAKLYKPKRRGHYKIRCRYDQQAKIFHKCYIQK